MQKIHEQQNREARNQGKKKQPYRALHTGYEQYCCNRIQRGNVHYIYQHKL